MATTAYSTWFKRELDVGQLIALMGGAPGEVGDWPEAGLPAKWRDWIRSDIVCSSCGAADATIVMPSKGKVSGAPVKQAHFRFVRPDGADAHNRFCEFYANRDGDVRIVEQLVDFGKAKSAETRLIRDLVCKGIAQGIFAQSHIRAMRQFFFDLKAASQRQVIATPEGLELVKSLRNHHSYYNQLPFHPSFGDLPNFDWGQAARFAFAEKHEELLIKCRRLSFQSAITRRALLLITQHHDEMVFDTSVMQPYYEATLRMCTFVGHYGGLGYSPKRVADFRSTGPSSPLLALCALLLSITDWNVAAAIEKFVAIRLAPPPVDQTLGNVIGLNPFHDYLAWDALYLTEEIAKDYPDFDYAEEMNTIEAGLREEHRIWKFRE